MFCQYNQKKGCFFLHGFDQIYIDEDNYQTRNLKVQSDLQMVTWVRGVSLIALAYAVVQDVNCLVEQFCASISELSIIHFK